jgi:hypothetical protein
MKFRVCGNGVINDSRKVMEIIVKTWYNVQIYGYSLAMSEWLDSDEMIGMWGSVGSGDGGLGSIYFENNKDKMMFILRWLD